MKGIGRRRALMAGTIGAAFAAAPSAFAQDGYPNKSIRLVVTARRLDRRGGPPARTVHERDLWGSRSWSTTSRASRVNTASQIVAEAKPDGYTLLLGNSNMATVPALYEKLLL